ncbi:putative murein hydrolase (TIGR00659 family) [Bacillus tianshenii]|uniref:Murein hydrolase (TIGR00659 family) n=1 Tax=Sutcliffiella tianshenii TaxID=1463404 RepID=A0ABS2P4R6_9BACI|nr:putative murein hydrolase (TIGR00659 family) [Bacillus tianshenii]
MIYIIGIVFFFLTILAYMGMKVIYEHVGWPLLVPVATTTMLLIVLLLATNIHYETYMTGGKWINELLSPAVVALAYPLYRNRGKIYQYMLPLFAGVASGIAAGLISGFAFVKMAGLDRAYAATFLPKSVTSPIAMDIASMTGGIPSLAAAFVVLSGMMGAIFGPYLLKMFHIEHFLGIGVGYGNAAHGIGTAKAMEYGKEEAAFSSISMILSAIVYAFMLPVAVQYLL